MWWYYANCHPLTWTIYYIHWPYNFFFKNFFLVPIIEFGWRLCIHSWLWLSLQYEYLEKLYLYIYIYWGAWELKRESGAAGIHQNFHDHHHHHRTFIAVISSLYTSLISNLIWKPLILWNPSYYLSTRKLRIYEKKDSSWNFFVDFVNTEEIYTLFFFFFLFFWENRNFLLVWICIEFYK